MSRKPLTKKIRFEVFKRDSFKCQYCGDAAPEVVLVVDHIKPVKAGGDNAPANLITACFPCNAGKGPRELNDQTTIEKQRNQLEMLQAKKEQIDMIAKWYAGLNKLDDHATEKLAKTWEDLAPGWACNEIGKASLGKWVKKFSFNEVLAAMRAASTYLDFGSEGHVSSDSWNLAFKKIPGVCVTERRAKENPELKEWNSIRATARHKCSYFNEWKAISLIEDARESGVSLNTLKGIARNTTTWTNFQDNIEDAILDAKEERSQDAQSVH